MSVASFKNLPLVTKIGLVVITLVDSSNLSNETNYWSLL